MTRLGYHIKHPDARTGGGQEVEAVDPELQEEFEAMMLSQTESEEKVSVASEHAIAGGGSGSEAPGTRLGYHIKHPDARTGGGQEVEAVDPELQEEFEAMLSASNV